jgi:hypothetical protein
MEEQTIVLPCAACGASPTAPGRTQPSTVLVPVERGEDWHEAAQEIARTLTLIRESLAEPPEDLDEVVATLETRAWQLAFQLDALTGF